MGSVCGVVVWGVCVGRVCGECVWGGCVGGVWRVCVWGGCVWGGCVRGVCVLGTVGVCECVQYWPDLTHNSGSAPRVLARLTRLRGLFS